MKFVGSEEEQRALHAAVCRAMEASPSESTLDAIREYPDFPQGSRTWDERAYHPDSNGVVRPLKEIWPKGRMPLTIGWAIRMVQMLGAGPVSTGLRLAWSDSSQSRLALGEQEG